MSKSKILITGGHGFIGANIIKVLASDYYFLAPSKEELNLTDEEAVSVYLQKNKPDIVIHAANVGGLRTVTDDALVFENNIKMFFNIVRCRQYFKRMIVFGSGAEYDKRYDICLAKEEQFDQSIPADRYGLSKYIFSKYAQQADFITHLRIFGIYGFGENYQVRFISNSICKVLAGLPIQINKNVFFDYIYISDFVRILKHFIDQQPKETFYNVGSGQRIDLATIANHIVHVMGREDLPITIKEDSLGREYSCDVSRLRSELGGKFKFTSLDQAIDEMAEFYRIQKEVIDKSLLD